MLLKFTLTYKYAVSKYLHKLLIYIHISYTYLAMTLYKLCILLINTAVTYTAKLKKKETKNKTLPSKALKRKNKPGYHMTKLDYAVSFRPSSNFKI